MLAVLAAVSAGCTGKSIDLDAVFSQSDEPWYAVADPQEATEELCTGPPDCLQGYTTSGPVAADYLRFDSEEEAAEADEAETAPTRRSGTVLIRFTDERSNAAEQDMVAGWLAHDFAPDADLDDVFAEQPTGWYLQGNPQEATAELCAEFDCAQGYTTDQADYLKFDAAADAEATADAIGANAYRSRYLVLRFTDPGLTAEERTALEERVDGIHNSDD
ncbi:hypothetical protein GCM10027440_43800 [Nocardiopsis coralliicola]